MHRTWTDIHLVIVTRSKINHNVFVTGMYYVEHESLRSLHGAGHLPVEEHDRARVVQFIHLGSTHHHALAHAYGLVQLVTHLVEIRHLRDVYEIYDRKILHLLSHRVQRLVHRHTLAVPVVTKANHNDTVFFRLDCLVNVPSRGKVR